MKNLLDAITVDTISGIITFIFLLVVLSYYVLLFVRIRKTEVIDTFSSISVIIPAHNEEEYIEECITSVLDADFKGKKQIIVVNDGSIDKTGEILQKFKNSIEIIQTNHSGKADSLNKALKQCTGEVIAVVDGDSIIHKNALTEIVKELGKEKVGGACAVVKVKNRTKVFPMWSHIEQLYNSLMRSLFSKINANITTPGPLSVYRASVLKKINGFSTEGFSEDVDVTIRIIRAGYTVKFAEKAISETNIPYDIKGILRQRTRFARGLLNILKRHMKFNRTVIDLYTLPLFLFSYIQAVIMGSLTLYNISFGYYTYFVSKGVFFDFSVLKFFFEWFSLIGFFKWTFSVLSGAAPFTFVAGVGIISTLLSYPLFVFAILKFDRKIDLWHVIPFLFMFPFWLFVMVLYILCLPEYFRKSQYNIWKKNE